MKKKIMCALLSCVTALGISCKSKNTLDVHHGIADQSKLYGMCYLMEERNLNEIDVEMGNIFLKEIPFSENTSFSIFSITSCKALLPASFSFCWRSCFFSNSRSPASFCRLLRSITSRMYAVS